MKMIDSSLLMIFSVNKKKKTGGHYITSKVHFKSQQIYFLMFSKSSSWLDDQLFSDLQDMKILRNLLNKVSAQTTKQSSTVLNPVTC